MPNGQPIHQCSLFIIEHSSVFLRRFAFSFFISVSVSKFLFFQYYCYYGCYRDVCQPVRDWRCRVRCIVIIVTFMPPINCNNNNNQSCRSVSHLLNWFGDRMCLIIMNLVSTSLTRCSDDDDAIRCANCEEVIRPMLTDFSHLILESSTDANTYMYWRTSNV